MNVLQMMIPAKDRPPHSTLDLWLNMIHRRRDTFEGFCEIEADRGFITPVISLSSSKGQEVVRLLLFRVLEELAESYLSDDPNHWKEEIIDALNYLLSVCLLDRHLFGDYYLASFMHEVTSGFIFEPSVKISEKDLATITILYGGKLGDFLRNRAWMNRAQDPMFAADDLLQDAVEQSLKIMLKSFDSFGEFWAFYIAKDDVLKFRLETKY